MLVLSGKIMITGIVETIKKNIPIQLTASLVSPNYQIIQISTWISLVYWSLVYCRTSTFPPKTLLPTCIPIPILFFIFENFLDDRWGSYGALLNILESNTKRPVFLRWGEKQHHEARVESTRSATVVSWEKERKEANTVEFEWRSIWNDQLSRNACEHGSLPRKLSCLRVAMGHGCCEKS